MATAIETVRPGPTTPPPRARELDSGAVLIPLSAMTWEGFREWAQSSDFPERGKIAFLGEEVFVDMSPERVNSHVEPKGEIYYVLRHFVRDTDAGFVFADGLRVSNKAAQVSNEPDLVFVSRSTLQTGRATLVESSDGRDYGELIGTPDLVVEVVSPSSVGKDYRLLRSRYHAAGIPEYWLIDAREDELRFDILRIVPDGYEAVPAREGWLASALLNREFRLERRFDPLGLWQYTLHVRALGAA
jgi:Uma2 family endonuclease